MGKFNALAISLSALLLLSILAASMADVIPLTEDTFSDKIKEKDTAWFVLFCVPWCKHCKNLGSLWEDFGKVVEGEDEIEAGRVDCGASKPVCSKVDIHSYPTFKLFYNGEEVAKYEGPREVESLKAFVVEETEKAVTKALEDGVSDIAEEKKVFISPWFYIKDFLRLFFIA
ncbi:hypothetical protein V2J09_006491 [Rumex salicifolius]